MQGWDLLCLDVTCRVRAMLWSRGPEAVDGVMVWCATGGSGHSGGRGAVWVWEFRATCGEGCTVGSGRTYLSPGLPIQSGSVMADCCSSVISTPRRIVLRGGSASL